MGYLIETTEGEGTELTINSNTLPAYTIDYNLTGEDPAQKPMVPMLKFIRTVKSYQL